MTELFSTGKFANLCGLKRDTIIFYDKIGLLKPEKVTEKGYRYYSMRSYYFMMWVRMMQGCGLSLDEIITCKDENNEDNLLALIESGTDNLIEKHKQLGFQIQYNKFLLENLESIKNMEPDTCYEFDLPADYYISSLPYYIEQDYSDGNIAFNQQCYDEYRQYMKDHNIPFEFFDGILINYADWKQKKKCFHIITLVPEPIDCERFRISPSSKYLCMVSQEGYKLNISKIEQMYKYAADKGLTLSNDVFICSLAEYHILYDKENDLYLYTIQILN